jgi:exonuclease III
MPPLLQVFLSREQGHPMSAVDDNLDQARVAWRRLLHFSHLAPGQQTVSMSYENLQSNGLIGDELLEKPDHITRIYALNVNGLQLDARGGKFRELCTMAMAIRADITCFSEHNLDTTKHYVNSICQDTAQIMETPRLTLSSSSNPATTIFKPGGTGIITHGSLASRLRDKGVDPLGRWTYQTFTGKAGKQFTVITCYQACVTTTKGTNTAYTQQLALLRLQGESHPNPRKAFCRDLKSLLSHFTSEMSEILVVGDFNETIDNAASGIARIMSAPDFATRPLIDLMSAKHGHQVFATYARGRRRIDFALGTEGVYHALRSIGYEPFGHRIFSDHRPFYLDLDTSQLFGNATPPFPSKGIRSVQSDCPQQVTTYLEEMDRMVTSRNILQRSRDLANEPGKNHSLAERLDRDMTQFCLAAAKKCRQFKPPAWSLLLNDLHAQIGILQRVISLCRTHIDHMAQIQRIQSQFGTRTPIPDTLKECRQELRKAQQAARQVARDSVRTRSEEQAQKIAALELEGSSDSKRQATIIRNLRKAEEIKRMYKKISRLRNRDTSSLTRVEVPADPTVSPKQAKEWRQIDAPDEILTALRNRNQQHFGQAAGTPLTLPPLSQEINFEANTVTTELILEGEYDSTTLDETMTLLVSHLTKLSAPQLSSGVTSEMLRGKLKSWKESTSTSPSGLHLGHWKSLVSRHNHSGEKDDSTDKDRYDRIQSKLLEIRLNLMNYAASHGYSYDRWKTIVNVMILKEPGNYKIHRLRVIHLYEADYNALLAMKWRELIHSAEDKNLLNVGTYGSRPNRSATTPVFLEEMMSEITRLTRKLLVTFDNDATSCYDRILPSLASIVSRKYGLSKTVALVMARTLKEARYKLKTSMGVSEEFYQHSESSPIYGTGQGSGNSPVIWAFISSTLFDCYEKRAHGATFATPDQSIIIPMYMVGFVDDTKCQTNSFFAEPQPSVETVVTKMQHDAQLWSDLLWSSSGDLELSKCSYHVYYYRFSIDGSPVLASGKIGQIHLRKSSSQTVIPIDGLSAYTAHKTLGHYKEPAGNQTKQYQVLKEKCDEFARFLRCSPLDHRESWTFYYTIFLPSAGYTLPNSFFSRRDLDNIQRQAMRELFAHCGFNRNTKRPLLYGPQSLGGAAFRSLYTEQGVGQVLQFLHQLRTNGQASALLKIAIAWAQYAVGTGKSIYSDTMTPLPHFESKWLKSLRQFLGDVDGSIEMDNPVLPIQRHHDSYIMDHVLASGKFTDKEICQINYCRLHLQVLTVSDIAMLHGQCLDRSKLHGDPSLLSSHTKLVRFHQERPPESAWKLWRRACGLRAHPSGDLYYPLGSWHVPASSLRMSWHAYTSQTTSSFYIREGNRFNTYFLDQDGQPDGSSEQCMDLPEDAIPVEASVDTQQWRITYKSEFQLESQLPPVTGFLMELQSSQMWEKHLFAELQLLASPEEVSIGLRDHPFAIASDGSVVKDSATFGWILSLEDGTRLAECAGPVFGSQPSSYRAEGYGMLAVLRFLKHLSVFYGNPLNSGFTHYIDNDALVTNVNILENMRGGPVDMDSGALEHPLRSDWDVLNEIRYTLGELPQNRTFKWVKGHQDRERSYDQLSLDAQLNVDADRLAGDYQQRKGAPHPEVPRFPHNPAQLVLSGQTITAGYKGRIRYAASSPALLQTIKERYNWDDQVIQMIDWPAHSSAIRSKHKQRVIIIKLIHDITPTNRRVARYGHSQDPQCPRCKAAEETCHHLLLCPSAQQWRRSFLQSLRKRCEELKTDPVLQEILVSRLEGWLVTSTLGLPVYSDKFTALLESQEKIGWPQIFNGRMSLKWQTLQQEYLTRTGNLSKNRTGHQWTKAIITHTWDQWMELWEERNRICHGIDNIHRHNLQSEQAKAELEAIYANRDNMLPQDRDLLFSSLAEHMHQKGNLQTLRNWLNLHRDLFKASITEAQRRSVQGVHSITSYFRSKVSRKEPSVAINAEE